MIVNLRRGFDRIFVVGFVCWCGFIVWYPHRAREKRFEWMLASANRINDGCRELDAEGTKIQEAIEKDENLNGQAKLNRSMEESRRLEKQWDDCTERVLNADKRAMERYSEPTYQSFAEPHNPILYYALAVTVPPAAFYGLVWAMLWTYFWVRRGFITSRMY
jgi:hypothetical protein